MKTLDFIRSKIAKDAGFKDWSEVLKSIGDNEKKLNLYIDRVAYCYVGEETPTHKNHDPIPHRFPFRLGRKQQRAVLCFDGKEVVVFPKGKEEMARITTMMWNQWHKDLCKDWGEKCECTFCKEF